VYLQYTGALVSGGSFTDAKDHLIVLGSLSKTYAMTGWRAGFALGPKPIIAAMSKLQSQSTSSAASFVQKASIAALTSSQECVAEMRADYLKLRDRILARLSEIPGITCTTPEGAFYVYPNVSAYLGKPGAQTTMELAGRLLHEAHVVTVPGEAFGTQHHLRFSYAVSHDDVEEGLKRMKEFFAKL
jgi:aspartate aminotransferase